MRRLRASNAEVELVRDFVSLQGDLFPPDANDAQVRRWLVRVGPQRVLDLFRLRIALWRASPVARGDRDLVERWRKAHRVLLAHPPLEIRDLAVYDALLGDTDIAAPHVNAAPEAAGTLDSRRAEVPA